MTLHRLGPGDPALMHAMLTLFAGVFDEPGTYESARPSRPIAAIALYSKLGKREDVLHFDIPVVPEPEA